MSLLRKNQLFFNQDPDGIKIDVSNQTPLPVSDGFVCPNDVWRASSNMYNFSGVVTDLFDNLHSVVTDSTSNDPKELLIHFNNAVITNVIAIGAFNGNGGTFSNVEIQIARSDGVFITIVDESTDSTIKQTADYALPLTVGFNALKIRFHTTNSIVISNLVIPTVKATVSRIQAVSDATGVVEDIKSFDGALNVTDGLVHKNFVNRFFVAPTGIATTLAVSVTAQDRSFTVVSSAGLAIGGFLNISEVQTTEIALLITNIVANVITVSRPIDFAYGIGAAITGITKNMAVDGSVTPVVFRLTPPPSGPNSIYQITRMLIQMSHAGVPDDGKFGGIPALTNGVLLRANVSGVYQTATFWLSNSDLKTDMFNLPYTDKAPAGVNGTNGRWTITEAGAIFEMNGANGDFLEMMIQDDLTGLVTFEVKNQGRVFSGN